MKAELQDLDDKALNATIEMAFKETPQNDAVLWPATREWKRRHPGTLSPFLFWNAIEKGGFPPCYKGPTSTIDLDTGEIITMDPGTPQA